VGVVDDLGESNKLSRLANQIAKNLFRLERDQAPPSFDAEAERRLSIPPAALEASALARTESDRGEQKALLKRALSSHPDYLEVRLLLGDYLLDEGLPREATEVLAGARGRGLLYQRAYFDLGLAYLGASEPRLAFEVFRNLAVTEESKAASYNNLGVSLMRLDRIPEAIEAFERRGARSEGKPIFSTSPGPSGGGEGALAFELFEKLAAEDPIDAEATSCWRPRRSQARSDVAERSGATALVLAPISRASTRERSRTGSDRSAPSRQAPISLRSALRSRSKKTSSGSWSCWTCGSSAREEGPKKRSSSCSEAYTAIRTTPEAGASSPTSTAKGESFRRLCPSSRSSSGPSLPRKRTFGSRASISRCRSRGRPSKKWRKRSSRPEHPGARGLRADRAASL
jgi:tetratricopeptide (TPR) repeat protein